MALAATPNAQWRHAGYMSGSADPSTFTGADDADHGVPTDFGMVTLPFTPIHIMLALMLMPAYSMFLWG